ncbi:hypothetical protein [Methylocella silvestris]|uniref:Uncharacterized protein n=1 Tax=Methylocella silvestris TaxID=199596 RepID=A0A2J7TDY0_METSI|nr:hypothetical protein [Methylocella silvestris]PNG24953.1 hypothetical protein CR492_15740 [Methylocella silvestris]
MNFKQRWVAAALTASMAMADLAAAAPTSGFVATAPAIRALAAPAEPQATEKAYYYHRRRYYRPYYHRRYYRRYYYHPRYYHPYYHRRYWHRYW